MISVNLVARRQFYQQDVVAWSVRQLDESGLPARGEEIRKRLDDPMPSRAIQKHRQLKSLGNPGHR